MTPVSKGCPECGFRLGPHCAAKGCQWKKCLRAPSCGWGVPGRRWVSPSEEPPPKT
jgi:hypothetical protein